MARFCMRFDGPKYSSVRKCTRDGMSFARVNRFGGSSSRDEARACRLEFRSFEPLILDSPCEATPRGDNRDKCHDAYKQMFLEVAAPIRGDRIRTMRNRPLYACHATACCRDSPRPSMPSSTVSPAFIYCGGFIPSPTPAGVPVLITSPGSSVMNSLR
jgi:hypothetical protein